MIGSPENAPGERIIGGNALDGSDSLARFGFQNPVDQERRERMGKTVKDLFQFFPIQGRIFRLGMNRILPELILWLIYREKGKAGFLPP